MKQSTRSIFIVPVLGVLATLLGLGIYWYALLADYDNQREQARTHMTQLASQTAQALMREYDTFLAKLDFFSNLLALEWLDRDYADFERIFEIAVNALPQGAIAQVYVVGPAGVPIYAISVDGEIPFQDYTAYSLADREYFKIHRQGERDQAFISPPIKDRNSGDWVIQISRGLWDNGRFEGVLLLNVSVRHASEALEALFEDTSDVAFVVRDDGIFLLRSANFENVSQQRLPSHVEFMTQSEHESGSYESFGVIDGVQRLYAWWRGQRFPVVVGVGYATDKALTPVDKTIRSSLIGNAVTSILLLIAVLFLARSWVHRAQRTHALEETSDRLRDALDAGHMGTWVLDVNSKAMAVDKTFKENVGESSTTKINSLQTWLAHVHEDDRARVEAYIDHCCDQQNSSSDIEYRVVRADGSIGWVTDSARLVESDKYQNTQRIVGINRDISLIKESQLETQASQERLAKLAALVPGAVYQYQLDEDGSSYFPFSSPGLQQVYDVDPEAVVQSAQPVFDRVAEEDLARVQAEILESARTLNDWRSEYRVIRPDGTIRWVAGQARPERLDNGSIMWHGYLQDVTLDHQTAAALKASESYLRLTLQAVEDGIWSFDHCSEELKLDDHIRAMLGYEGDQWGLMSRTAFLDMVHPSDRTRMLNDVENLFDRGRRAGLWVEFRLRTAQENWLWVQARGRVVEWKDDTSPAKTVGLMSDISEQVSQRMLREALLNHSPTAIAVMDRDMRLLEANESFRDVFLTNDRRLDELDVRHLTSSLQGTEELRQVIARVRHNGVLREDFALIGGDGETHWFDVHGLLLDPDDTDSPIVWTLTDICDRHKAERDLKTEQQRLTTLLQRIHDGVLIEDSEQTVVFVNQRWCQIMGIEIAPELLVGVTHEGLKDLIGPARMPWLEIDVTNQSDPTMVVAEQRHYEIERQQIQRMDEFMGTVWFMRDITDWRTQEARLTRMALTDQLTGLANRRSFMESFRRVVYEQSTGTHDRAPGVLMMLDLDHFKRVNDTYGHAGGDRVLRKLGQILTAQTRGEDLAGRLGGEEFAIVLPGIGLQTGEDIAQRIRRAVEAAPTDIDTDQVHVTISIGIVVLGGDTPEDLLEKADVALYEAKRTGRNRVCRWVEGMAMKRPDKPV